MPKQRVEWGIGDPTISVVGERFCNPYTTELVVKRKVQKLSNDHYEVFDLTGNLLLQIDGGVWAFHRKRVMRDASGFTVLTMHEKALSLRNKWKAYEGESQNLVFSVQQPHALSLKTSLDVFLPRNSKKDSSDFRASGSFINLSFKVYKDDALLAGVTENFSWGSFCKGKCSFKVKVNPEVDYAFIVALLVIMDNQDS